MLRYQASGTLSTLFPSVLSRSPFVLVSYLFFLCFFRYRYEYIVYLTLFSFACIVSSVWTCIISPPVSPAEQVGRGWYLLLLQVLMPRQSRFHYLQADPSSYWTASNNDWVIGIEAVTWCIWTHSSPKGCIVFHSHSGQHSRQLLREAVLLNVPMTCSRPSSSDLQRQWAPRSPNSRSHFSFLGLQKFTFISEYLLLWFGLAGKALGDKEPRIKNKCFKIKQSAFLN